MDEMTDLTTLTNIGTELERKLHAAGITSAAQLKEIGGKDAFIKAKRLFPEMCLVHLYALHGAATNQEYHQLSEETKADLKQFNKKLNELD